MFDKTQLIGYQSAQNIDTQISDKETLLMEEAYRTGLHPAEGIKEPGITTFARGPLAPTFIGNGTFLKCDRCEYIHDAGKYDVAFVGIPYDSGCSQRSGTRMGPQGIRHASLGFTPYNPDYGIDLFENLKICDVGDIYPIPANSEKLLHRSQKGFTTSNFKVYFQSLWAATIRQVIHLCGGLLLVLMVT